MISVGTGTGTHSTLLRRACARRTITATASKTPSQSRSQTGATPRHSRAYVRASTIAVVMARTTATSDVRIAPAAEMTSYSRPHISSLISATLRETRRSAARVRRRGRANAHTWGFVSKR